MTIPTSGAPVAAWYADPQDPSQLRWWDGTQWTAHTTPVPQATQQPAAASAPPAYGERTEQAPVYATPSVAPGYAVQPPAQTQAPSYAAQYTPQQYGQAARVPDGTPTANWLIWVYVLLPLLSLVLIFSWDINGYMRSLIENPGASSMTLMLDPGYLVMTLGSWILFAAMIALAVLDWRWLGQQGYQRRFHWAWAILNSLVYIIGRSVVVKRQAGRGFAPMWVSIAVTIVSLIAIIVWTVSLMSTMFTLIEQTPGLVS